MPRGQPHDPALKAQVLAALATGESVNAVAKTFGVSRSTVIAWRNATPISTDVQHQKGKEIVEQVAAYMVESIETLRTHMRFARDEEWLRRQSAHELAIFDGVIFDKFVRVLEAQQAYERERQAQLVDGQQPVYVEGEGCEDDV